MALPYFTQLRKRYVTATSSSSNDTFSTPVPARSKYVTAWFNSTLKASQTAAANTVEVLQNNSTVISSGTATTTSTGNAAFEIPMTATSNIILNQGDVLVTVCSSCVGGTITHVLLEF